MLKLRSFTLIFILLVGFKSRAQDRVQAQASINALCTPEMAGRGYVNDGVNVAGDYLAEQFKTIGLLPIDDDYKHEFTLDVNTIPDVDLSIDNIDLKDGFEYMVSPSSPSTDFDAEIFYVNEELLSTKKGFKKIKKALKKGKVPVLAKYDSKNQQVKENIKKIKECGKTKAIVYLTESLVYSVGREQSELAEVYIRSEYFDSSAKTISLKIISEFRSQFKSANICGMVKGTEIPDSFVLLCGHYDHLGKMGDAFYHGANDNASGIAIMLDLAKYFVENPQKYSIVFVAFAGEEAGLVGSFNYVKSPPAETPINNIRFVFNMDLMGNGEEGATIVNGSVFKNEFEALTKINTENGYLPKIKSRGKAANSDHYFFSEVGVPSFFIYTMGDYTHYHIPEDNADNLILDEYYDANFKLIRDFILYLN